LGFWGDGVVLLRQAGLAESPPRTAVLGGVGLAAVLLTGTAVPVTLGGAPRVIVPESRNYVFYSLDLGL